MTTPAAGPAERRFHDRLTELVLASDGLTPPVPGPRRMDKRGRRGPRASRASLRVLCATGRLRGYGRRASPERRRVGRDRLHRARFGTRRRSAPRSQAAEEGVMTTAEHRVRRSAEDIGWSASCTCGWRTTRRARDLRGNDVARHLYTTAPHAEAGDSHAGTRHD